MPERLLGDDTVGVFVDLRDEGKIRHIGISSRSIDRVLTSVH